jgi:tetratricopeptide (TPR) repeat protein
LDTCDKAIGNTALVRNTLQAVVDACAIPGVESENDWLRPHPRYVWEYADLLRTSSTTRNEALKLLRGVLRRSWALAGAWHVLADQRWVERESSALQAYAIASYLAPHNEHYARAYFDALGHADREEEGLQWLEQRVKDLGGSNRGVSTWITYISALEDRGHPERAITVCQACLQIHPDSAPAIAFAVAFLARMGKWTDADEQLQKLAQLDAEGAFHEAATAFYRMRGQRPTALEYAEKWVRGCPRSMAARQAVLELKSGLLGPEAAVQQAGSWLREFPANEDFEEAFCRFARDIDRRRTLGVLRRRVARNREDGWAWRELAFTSMALYKMGDEVHRNRHRRRIVRYLSEADRVAPDDSPTLRAQGLWKEGQGDWRGAVDCYVESIRCDPTHFFAYQRVWEVSSRFSEEGRRELWNAIQPLFLQTTAHLANALEMMRLLAERFGVRETEKVVGEWREQRPDDPNVVQAYVDLLLNHGHGRSDIERGLKLLLVAVERYPYHSGLHFSLASAYRALGEFKNAKEVFQELAWRHSDDVSVLIQLAWIAQHDGDTEQALRLVGSACEQQPQNPAPIDARARILIDAGRVDDARIAAALSLEQHAKRVPIYERAIALFAESGSPERAVDAARKGTTMFPRGAYLWLLLGRTLKQFPQFAAVGEIEACFRRSLQLNCGLFESADWLAVLLAEQGRHEDSTKIVESIEPHMSDPAPALGRLAWVKRKSGQKEQAYIELKTLLGKEPWYTWGWNQLLTWLEDDKDGYRAKDLLFSVPAQMMSDVAFRQRRLRLLEMAKIDTRAIDAEWEVLLAEFPENVPLHQRRYDSLAAENRWDLASSLLEKITPIGGHDSFLLARMIELECRNGKRSDAVDHGLQVLFAALEQSPWPVNQAWSHLKKAGWTDDFAAQFWTRLKAGAKPTHRALAYYADDLLASDHTPRWLRWMRHTRLNHTTRRLYQLMQILERSNWLDHRHIAGLFAGLNQHRHGKIVLSSWKRMEDRHLERDSAIWAQIGVAMVNLDRKSAGRVFMRDWRKRVGVPMWALVNYLSCIGRVRRSDLNEVASTCHDALQDLPHDHCARYLAYIGAEALALNNDASGLLDAWDRYGVYFEGSLKQGEYFPENLKYLFGDLPVLARALRSNDLQAASKMTRALRWLRIWDQQFRLPVLRARRVVGRLILILWLAGMIAVLFLRLRR